MTREARRQVEVVQMLIRCILETHGCLPAVNLWMPSGIPEPNPYFLLNLILQKTNAVTEQTLLHKPSQADHRWSDALGASGTDTGRLHQAEKMLQSIHEAGSYAHGHVYSGTCVHVCKRVHMRVSTGVCALTYRITMA